MPIRNIEFYDFNQSLNPWLPIKITNPYSNKSVSSYGLIDTGASCCVIPDFYSSILGHNLTKGISCLGNGAGSITNETPIAFMRNLPIILLGVKEFLDKFELFINYPTKVFSITYPS
jgi:hypothetical protein